MMTPLPYLSLIKASGAGAGKFLQAQLTAQVVGLQSPAATFSAYCSPKGQVIATLLVSPRDDHWLLVVEASLLTPLVERLRKFILREDVRLEPLPDLYVTGVEPQETQADRVIMLEPGALPIRYGLSELKPAGDPEATSGWRRTELLLGIPWLDALSSEKHIPQMLGLDAIGAVSFNKGCYPGQEVIARARHLGKVKRFPLVLDITGPKTPDQGTACIVRTSSGQVDAALVQCVTTSATTFTVFMVAAMPPDEEVLALEQNDVEWTASRSTRQP